ncbi:hypothetical protein ACFR9U_17295 [Halorientalis brevis]|uniref:t-SNARE coiled-coil homology domain-containing protein n=1 Tax=Halorientalis brevis TaxID=1126241 RepID=A0ABD6CEM5_9EURY|nr:ELKS/Rab6-interacting/CAST family protein [Halorientalis brevis]
MSESESYEEVTVASNGITVIKTFEADAFPVPAIAFRIKSDRTEAVTVRIVDDVPENVAVEDLGFHPEYGSEFWTIEDDVITFEREIESEEQYTTVYGIRATGTDNVEQFLTEPDVADVDPPLEDEDGVVGGSGSDVVRDVISGNTDSVPGLDDEETDEDIGTLDLTDPNAEEQNGEADTNGEVEEDDEEEAESDAEADTDDEDETDEADAETAETEDDSAEQSTAATNGSAPAVESVASALATEIRNGEVSDDDLDVLRDELDLDGASENGAEDARIQKLQTDVADLEAYTDALEEFLEENGTGADLIDDVQSGLDDVQSKLDGLESDISDNSEQVDSLDDSVGGIRDDLQSLKGDIKDLDDDLEDVQETMTDLEDDMADVDDVASQVDELDSEIEELKEWREQLSNVLGATDG